MSCLYKLHEAFPNKTKQEMEEIINRINFIRSTSSDKTEASALLKELIEEQKFANMGKANQIVGEYLAEQFAIDRINTEGFSDISQAMESLFGKTRSTIKNVGVNAEALIDRARARYIEMFGKAMESSGLYTVFRTGELDKEIMEAMIGGKKTGLSKEVQGSIPLLKHFTDTIWNDLNNAGLFIPYRDDFMTPIFHGGEKIKAAGATAWTYGLLKHLNLKETFKDITPDTAKAFLDGLRAGKTLEELSGSNTFAAELLEDYTQFVGRDNGYGADIRSFLLDERYDNLGERRQKGRSYVWKSGEDLYEYLKAFGKYETVHDMYMAYARRSAREVGMVTMFGPSPNKTINSLLRYLSQQKGLNTFQMSVIETKVNYWRTYLASGIPNATSRIGRYAEMLRDLTAASWLGSAGISQLMDVSQGILMYHAKDGQNLLTSTAKFMRNYMSALKAPLDPEMINAAYLYGDSVLEELNKAMRGQGTTKSSRFAKLVYTASGAEYMNRVSWIANYKTYVGLLKDMADKGKLTNTQATLLSKYGLDLDDLIVAGKALENVAHPRDIVSHPIDIFFDNRRGMTPKQYRAYLQERIDLFIVDNIKEGSPVPGMRENRLLMLNSFDVDSPARAGLLLMNQFKQIPLKIALDFSHAVSLVSGEKDFTKALMTKSGAAFVGQSIAISASIAAMVHILTQLKNGKNMDEIEEDFKKRPLDNFLYVLFRANAAAPFADLMVGAARPEDIASKALTPAAKAFLAPVTLGYTALSNVVERDEFANELLLKRATAAAKNVIPFQNYYFMTPLVEEMGLTQENIINMLEDSLP